MAIHRVLDPVLVGPYTVLENGIASKETKKRDASCSPVEDQLVLPHSSVRSSESESSGINAPTPFSPSAHTQLFIAFYSDRSSLSLSRRKTTKRGPWFYPKPFPNRTSRSILHSLRDMSERRCLGLYVFLFL